MNPVQFLAWGGGGGGGGEKKFIITIEGLKARVIYSETSLIRTHLKQNPS